MKLLVTSATSELGRTISEGLAKNHALTLTDLPRGGRAPRGVKPHSLGHDPDTDALVRGMDAVVHVGFGGHEAEATPLLDYLTRCTYNLLTACLNTGVKRFVYLHTLRVFEGYEPHLTVTERWKPLPTTEPAILASHLGEYVCREFAREHPQLEVISLRLGFPIVPGTRAAATRTKQPAALCSADLVLALDRALGAKVPKRWNPVHVQSPVPGARFLMSGAETLIGFPKKAA